MTRLGRSRGPVCAVLVLGALAAPLVASPARGARSPAADRGAPRILGPERQRIAVGDKGCGTLQALVVRRGKARGPIVVRVRSAGGRARIAPRAVTGRPGQAFRIRALGSMALTLCYVAAGRFDAVLAAVTALLRWEGRVRVPGGPLPLRRVFAWV